MDDDDESEIRSGFSTAGKCKIGARGRFYLE